MGKISGWLKVVREGVIIAGVLVLVIVQLSNSGWLRLGDRRDLVQPPVSLSPGVEKTPGKSVPQPELKKALKKEVSPEILKELARNREEAERLGVVVAQLEAEVKKRQAADHIYESEKKPGQTQVFKKIFARDAGGKEFPVAWAIFYPNTGEWKTGTYDLEFRVNTVESRAPDGGANLYSEIYVENKMDGDSRGEKYALGIAHTEFTLVEPKDKSFFWWDPQLDLGGAWHFDQCGDVGSGIEAGLSLSSYGKVKGASEWRFVRLSLAGGDHLNVGAAPVSWNLGNILPVIKDLWITPEASISLTTGEGGLGISISTTL